MAKSINKCHECNIYSIKDSCPNCNNKISEEKPGKFSVEDKYGEYRRKAKKEILKEKNLY
ncbi:ribosome biogenesis protein [Candidatus Woesearchaeota archaeon]|jgi:H/ACA ribonucleoprotein complex subunit 3|nr:ribosome biogenesis protein [Candidatus Woesearchaeota archaeon]MBT4387797.1 ribosome biogenesis protein [Candidatus Woesearchaeota archaeon]MBT4595616.1 ribosome biogenesis protein [Candidatus Woesearchaeota archaeon]MBT5740901.1 ribosome biogenesis protein [Candidatus Woesearchaeota archaeon]MBT7296176.1 ribosome biogenesis protein [Candidatus Woesearchaeota archaeon]